MVSNKNKKERNDFFFWSSYKTYAQISNAFGEHSVLCLIHNNTKKYLQIN